MKKRQPLVATIMTAMKITIIQFIISIIFAGTLFANEAKSQIILQKTISMNLEKVELKNVINEIQKQTNVVGVYLDPRRSSTTSKSTESGNYEAFVVVHY